MFFREEGGKPEKEGFLFHFLFKVNLSQLNFSLFPFAELVGGDPKPQHLERTRVVGLKNYSKNHRRHEKAGERKQQQEQNPDNNQVNDENFKLWDDGPNFDTNLQQNVVSLVDRTAYLTCRVFDRGNKTVIRLAYKD